jgi:pyrroline-5-carboxylate reductase
MKVLIVGYGNMGKTYGQSFINSRFIKAEDIFVLSRTPIAKSLNEIIPFKNFLSHPSNIISKLDIIIIAVKPQDFPLVAEQISTFLNKQQLIISIMAGVTLKSIFKKLNCAKIVRSMPNIPTQIGKGMTVFTATNAVDRKELFIIQNLINTTGKSIYVEKEELLNAATAISGSGPAYVFYFMNAMIEAAEKLGFSSSEAELLVNQTFMGSVDLQNAAKLSNSQWIEKVKSKGGTTEQALNVFSENNTTEIIGNAIFAANKRAKELGS